MAERAERAAREADRRERGTANGRAGEQKGELPASNEAQGRRAQGARGVAERGTSRRAGGRTATEAGRTDKGASGQQQGRKKQGKGGKARHTADGAARAQHEKMRSIRLTDGKILYTISRSI